MVCIMSILWFIIQAAQRNLVYPHYAWIIYAWYPERWWTEEMANETLEGCPDEVLEDFLIQSRAHMIHNLPEPDDIDIITDAGIVRISVIITCIRAYSYIVTLPSSLQETSQGCMNKN